MLRAGKPLSVRTKLISGFTILGAVILVLVALLFWSRIVSMRSHDTLSEAHSYLEHALELDGLINRQVGSAHSVVTEQGDREVFDRSTRAVRSFLSAWLTELENDPEAVAEYIGEVRGIERSCEAINQSLEEAVSMSSEGRYAQAMLQLDRILSDGYEKGIQSRVRALIEKNRLEVSRSEADARSASNTATVIVWVVLGLGVAVAVAVPAVLTRDVIGSLGRLERGIREVSQGEYDHPIEIEKMDEFGELAAEFNEMSRKARRLLDSEREAAAARARAEASEQHTQELRDLVDIAAHELRHPLTVFMGYSEILIDCGGDLDDEFVMTAIREIHKASIRLSQLVTELLDTSRIESGQIILDLEEVGPYAIIEGALAQVEEPADRDRVVVERCEIAVTIRADRGKVEQVLVGLLENALKFSPGESTVDLWCTVAGDEVVFHVADRGCGIPEEDREHVFERFYQVGDVMSHSLPGIGLGLYIAEKIVDAHGGWISVEPREGGGSTFAFGLPVRGPGNA